jgi:hypothetical protein
VKALIRAIQLQKKVSVQKVARVIGLIVSILPASKFGKIHYRELERAKLQALAGSRNFDKSCRWPRSCLKGLKWWRDSQPGWKCSFALLTPSSTLITDASLEGWGAIWDGHEIYGPWESESESRIDELELLAILFAIQCWPCDVMPGETVQLWCNNQVAVAYIRNMGGRVARLDKIACEIWSELEKRDVFLLASYINTNDNPADALTRGVSNKKKNSCSIAKCN